jgi:hypothetical protein
MPDPMSKKFAAAAGSYAIVVAAVGRDAVTVVRREMLRIGSGPSSRRATAPSGGQRGAEYSWSLTPLGKSYHGGSPEDSKTTI